MNTPKEAGYKMPAEWHPHERCWMAWPCHKPTWYLVGLDRARKAYAKVANAIAQYEPVTIILNKEDKQQAQKLCGAHIDLMCLPINDSWTRDTGCTFLLNPRGSLAGVDWMYNAWGNNYDDYQRDDALAAHLISHTHAQYFRAPLVMEGGSFHTDGEGTILTTQECLLNRNRNPNLSQKEIADYLCEYLGAEHVIWLNKGIIDDETDGHVDEIATFIAPGKVLCLITSDSTDPNYELLRENHALLCAARDAKGNLLEVITVEQPPATILHGVRLTLSYINFYLANGGLIMPSFGYADYDKEAYNLFTQLFPGRKITQIEALDVFAGGGGIHCITQQQPKFNCRLG